MSLEEEIQEHAATVSTQSYSMSVGEMVSMYADDELDLHPEFQRFFRWTDEQKSRFIESLLLAIPVPPIFVAEQETGKWDVIDGLQRLSTILELIGELKSEDNELRPPLVLTRTSYLPGLEGMRWDAGGDQDSELPESAKIKIKRARIDVNIVKSSSDELAKYEIFQRLNTGGATATDQEVRNCILIMTSKEFFEWISALSRNEDFRSCIPLTDRALEEAYDLELVVRFVILSTATIEELSKITELGEFLTHESRARARNVEFDKEGMQAAFETTFSFLSTTLGENSFRRYDREKNKYIGAMLISLYEVIAVGLGKLLLEGDDLPESQVFARRHKELWYHESLTENVGSGIRASTRIPKTVEFGREWLNEGAQ